jgi:hypothetical protein
MSQKTETTRVKKKGDKKPNRKRENAIKHKAKKS